MDSSLLKQIAEEIAQQTFLANLPYLATLLALVIVSAAAASYGASYLSRRGQQAATRADFAELQRQLESTTKLTESVKIQVQAVSARMTKVEDIKREKLERYLLLSYSVSDYHMSFMAHHYFMQEAPSGQSPILEAGMLQELYFPELRDAHGRFASAAAALQIWTAKGMQMQVDQLRSGATKGPPSAKHMEDYEVLLGALNTELYGVRSAASKLASTLLYVHRS